MIRTIEINLLDSACVVRRLRQGIAYPLMLCKQPTPKGSMVPCASP
jgi:hypothetical protein